MVPSQALAVIQNPDITRGQPSAAYPPLMDDLERKAAERCVLWGVVGRGEDEAL